MLLASLLPLALAQKSEPSPFDQPFLDPLAVPSRSAPPQLTFKVVADIPLPGPLPGPGPRLVGDRIEIPVAGGMATTRWVADAEPVLELETAHELPTPEGSSDWVEAPDGRFRARTEPGGRISMQKRCPRCRDGWRSRWKLRMPGSTPAPPLLTEKRVYVGTMDNRVYALTRRNGHRAWATDVEDRVARPVVLWQGVGDAKGFEAILVLPGSGSRLIALDAQTGLRVADFELSEAGGRLRSTPLATPDGKIIVARERYKATEASLIVLQLAPPPGATEGARSSGPNSTP